MEWYKKFIENYGDMLVFMGITTAFGIGFIVAGTIMENGELKAVGVTLLIGVAQLANNKSRTTKPKKQE